MHPSRRGLAVLAALATLTLSIALRGGPAVAEPAFGAPIRVGTGGFEPGIDISPTGTMFVNAPSGLGVQSKLWRSEDGGSNWTAITFPTEFRRLPGGGDSDVVVGHDGRVYFLDLWVGSNTVLRSDDDGKTWTFGHPFGSFPVVDRQWIAVGRKHEVAGQAFDYVYSTAQQFVAPNNLIVSRSTDSGTTFINHTVSPGGAQQTPGQIVADDNGFVAVAWARRGEPQLARSTDDGQTWTSVPVYEIGEVYSPPYIIALAQDGNDLHMVWTSQFDFSVRYSRSGNLGLTWSSPVSISSAGSNMFPWVAARDGKVAIAWYGSDVDPENPVDPNEASASVSWRIGYAESLDGGEIFSAPVDASPQIVKKGRICTDGLGCPGLGQQDRDLGDLLQLAIDANGNSIVTYVSAAQAPMGVAVIKQLS